MARQRILHPNFFTNPELGNLKPLTRLLFEGLWCLADRAGRLEDHPVRIKLAVIPFDRGNPDLMLDELRAAGVILRYEIETRRFIQVVNFERFQHPHPNEAKSVIPSPASDIVISASDNVTAARADLQAFGVSSLRNTDPPLTPPRGDADARIAALRNLWNECAEKAGWRKWGSTDKTRRRQTLARLKEAPFDELRGLLEGAVFHPHLRGENDRGWVADPEWFFTAKALRKLRDGSWSSRRNRPTATSKAMPSCPCCNDLMTTDRCARCDSGNCKKCLTTEKTSGAGKAGKMLKVLAGDRRVNLAGKK